MRKIKLLAILTVMITMLISVNASAAVYDGELGKIEITGGIKMDKAYESTFNDTRTITGRSECGTNIIINISPDFNSDSMYDINNIEDNPIIVEIISSRP